MDIEVGSFDGIYFDYPVTHYLSADKSVIEHWFQVTWFTNETVPLFLLED